MKIKNILLLSIIAILAVGCTDKNKASSSDDSQADSVVANATWDYYILGSWQFSETAPEGKKGTGFSQGAEYFSGNGDYMRYTKDEKGVKTIYKGTWNLDDKENYVLHVNAQQEDGDKTIEEKYTIQSLEPEKTLNYAVGEAFRTAMFKEK